ncbi:hypothetical protein L210DRAFT_3545896 [Boletus edulis BED1]|uniref:Hydrophobin n=1 Tax=Boletus edulis BED1 TaxID=1328754 RepID=A0AAD4GD76_BOLED|nr:hypothetical protein L210DRAFT_3582750 [Boletus edulis BED1]KAF8416426.1 hypothetical protein L210DRAFT_3582755 [Boletus edulis BED1]KAF8437531.1 hypothetical protein L210DRAFT_3545896 [Boletus edulis BED1]
MAYTLLVNGFSRVGLGCSTITVIGTGSGATCTQQPVCCTNNFVSRRALLITLLCNVERVDQPQPDVTALKSS